MFPPKHRLRRFKRRAVQIQEGDGVFVLFPHRDESDVGSGLIGFFAGRYDYIRASLNCPAEEGVSFDSAQRGYGGIPAVILGMGVSVHNFVAIYERYFISDSDRPCRGKGNVFRYGINASRLIQCAILGFPTIKTIASTV